MSHILTTKIKLLFSAQRLFSDLGFEQTSLRAITQKAEVNLASVNYHFGNKQGLIQAVMDLHLAIFFKCLEKEMLTLKAPYNANRFIVVFSNALLAMEKSKQGDCLIFVRLVGHAYNESQGHLKKYILVKYALPLNKVMMLAKTITTDLSDDMLFLRLHHMLGSVVFSMNAYQALHDILDADFDVELTLNTMIDSLSPYLSAGLMAPNKMSSL